MYIDVSCNSGSLGVVPDLLYTGMNLQNLGYFANYHKFCKIRGNLQNTPDFAESMVICVLYELFFQQADITFSYNNRVVPLFFNMIMVVNSLTKLFKG